MHREYEIIRCRTVKMTIFAHVYYSGIIHTYIWCRGSRFSYCHTGNRRCISHVQSFIIYFVYFSAYDSSPRITRHSLAAVARRPDLSSFPSISFGSRPCCFQRKKQTKRIYLYITRYLNRKSRKTSINQIIGVTRWEKFPMLVYTYTERLYVLSGVTWPHEKFMARLVR